MLEGEDGAPFRAGPQCPLQGRLTRCAQPLSLRWVFRDASARGQSTETGRKRQSLAIVILRLVLCVLNLAFYRAKIEATRRGLPAHEVAAAVRAILAKPAAAFRALGERRDPMMRAGGGNDGGLRARPRERICSATAWGLEMRGLKVCATKTAIRGCARRQGSAPRRENG